MDGVSVRRAGYLLAVILVACVATGCRHHDRDGKKNHGAHEPVDVCHTVEGDSLWREVGAAQIPPSTFSAAYQLTFSNVAADKGESGGKGMRVSGQLRRSADSVLWMTAGMFGIEAFRAWMKRDSLWVLNKMEGAVDVYALSAWRAQWPFLTLAERTEQPFVTAVLLGVIPEALLQAEVVYMERRPAAGGGAEVLRFGLLPAAGLNPAGLVVCDVAVADFRLLDLYWLTPETLSPMQLLPVMGAALPAAAAAALDKAALRLSYPTADSRQLTWRQADGSGVNIQLTYSKRKVNEPVEVSTDLPKKYKVRYVE